MKTTMICGHGSLGTRVAGNYGKILDFLGKVYKDTKETYAGTETGAVFSIVRHIASANPATSSTMDITHVTNTINRIVMYKDPFANLRDLCDIYSFCATNKSNVQMLLAEVMHRATSLSRDCSFNTQTKS